jgi:hypothetical protein
VLSTGSKIAGDGRGLLIQIIPAIDFMNTHPDGQGDRGKSARTIRFWTVLFAAGFFATLAAATVAVGGLPSQMTMEALVHGQRIEGTPLFFDASKVFLLTRNGTMTEFSPSEAQDYHKISESFSPYPQNMLRGMLEQEFGPNYEVSGTQHFLVVYPKGQRQWVDRFEDLYRSCVMYFTVRGFHLKAPQFPLVAIVFPTQDDFRHYAAKDSVPTPAGLLGYYSHKTNRVALFDIGGGRTSSAGWEQNFSTAIHEASHQTAFNTGIHNRWSPPPKWVAEGLGTMFEARGVNDSRKYGSQQDRINRGRLGDFQTIMAKHTPQTLADMLSSDRIFETDAISAYAQAWAFTFFLVEQMPREYARYLEKTASREPFTLYSSAQRLKDFTDVFGTNLALLDARFLRFIKDVK